jgi:hypothetical protein
MELYQCGDCGFQLLPEGETVIQSRFVAFRLAKTGEELPPGLMIQVRVCRDRNDCYRRERDRVSGLGDPMVGWFESLAQKR